ncbi:MAG TPA: hypothetical protein VGB85_10025 [Nannocystis sp.]
MTTRPASLALLVLLATTACAPGEPSGVAPEVLQTDFDLSPTPATTRVATLAWQPPVCPQVYRVRIDETYPPGLEKMLRTQAEHSESLMAVGAEPDSRADTWPPGPIPQDRVFAGRVVFRGPKTQQKPLHREFALSAALAGPASPDAPCYERTWDPVEDAVALAWPQLPARLAAVGETWRGARVEARCNRSACVDTVTRGGGRENHFRPCTTMSWRERLDGLFELGDDRVAVISSFWSDGHPLDEGLWSERTAVVSVEHGRLLHSQTFIHHTYTGIEREVRVDAIDSCPGGLVAAGWSPDAAASDGRETLLSALANSGDKPKPADKTRDGAR